MTILLYCNIAYSQNYLEKDTVDKITPVIIKGVRDNISLYSIKSTLSVPYSQVPNPDSVKDKNHMFFDTLKVKASKNQITKRLYDFIE